jgi:ABC-type phosphate transport system substrate-binding protein
MHTWGGWKQTIIAATVVIVATMALSTPAASAQRSPNDRLVVIANIANTVTQITVADLADIFLGKRRVWAAGGAILPCDLVEPLLPPEQTARGRFSQLYLSKDAASLKNYWIKMIFSGRGNPPIAMRSAKEVIQFVAENPGSIGYLYESQLTEEVKVVHLKGEE